MSRSFRRTGALGAATVALVAFAAAAPASATASQAVDLEFTLYAREVVVEEPEGPEDPGEGVPAPAVGDTFAFAEDLYRTKGGEKVGRDAVSCTVARVGGPDSPGDLTCVGTFILTGGPGGQIAGQVILPFSAETEQPAPFDIAVTGGTGDFKDVSGQIRSTEDGEYARLDFRLTR
ncbi:MULTISPECIES: hypothetical protein [Streptomyces]|uniref:DUF3224 domain-containing protein n=1 Tax=Streptomyces venezuelae TaxID=54571 RepID=A0A5P2AP42_STRVZ|nr:hypothetical protein [Streptomyces venezuelae]QES20042.1 hypothetical protein DEJ46_13765 [Streptomyces venezuelae]